MKRDWLNLLICLILTITFSSSAFAQGTTAPISGVVLDPTGAIVPGAKVTVKNTATGAEYNATSSSSGAYTVPALSSGTYLVTVESSGFKKVVVENVKLDLGVPATVNAVLEVGVASETVVIQSGAEVLQTQSPQVATTLVGRQIIETPQTSRDALDLVLNMPGTNTPGRPRTSTINGLPKGAINITMDGLNVQDNMIKSSDGFFTYVRPRIDAIEEVTVSTSNPGAESAGEGAVQIKFVTKGGTNEYHGGLYWYHRNPALNANYYFNNNSGQPRSRILLNQYGFKVGGPIKFPKLYDGKDKAFFFINYEEFRIPEQNLRSRTILRSSAQSGIFKYGSQSINLFALSSADGTVKSDTADPAINGILANIRKSTTVKGAIVDSTDLNTEPFSFINSGGQSRYFPTFRLDFNLTDKHHLENIYNYQFFTGKADFLNNADPAFPGSNILGIQGSNRFTNSTALRSTLTSSLVNEFRVGFNGGRVEFFNNVNSGMFADTLGYALNINSALGLQNYYTLRNGSSRTTPVIQFSDSLSWTKSTHNLNFGGNFTTIKSYSKSLSDGVVRQVNFGLAAGDPAEKLFTAANFPGATDAQLNQARSLYSLLTGRITSVTGILALDEETDKYKFAGEQIQRARMNEIGTFIQDNWRVKPNLTLNLGLRWEVQMPFTALNNSYSYAPYEAVFGISGPGNLFKPGVLQGSVPQYTRYEKGRKAYNTDWNTFAPSFGLAWTPRFSSKATNFLFGDSGQSVIRGGYSLAYVREGLGVFGSIYGANPGGTISASRDVTLSGSQKIAPGTLLRNGVPTAPIGLAGEPNYPLTAGITGSVNAFSPNLQTPYVQSWSFGIQREINRDTVIEMRYVANRAKKLWRQYNVNEINVLENGFLTDFKKAQSNFILSGKKSFAYNPAISGSQELSLISKFAGLKPADFYTNTTIFGFLDSNRPNTSGFGNYLYSTRALWDNRHTTIPANFFVVNPTVGTQGSFLVDNGAFTSYDSLQVELRRRLSKGLLVQGSYVFAKGLTDFFASSSTNFNNYVSLRDASLNKTLSPFNITHGFKATWVYELPFGKGKSFGGNVGKFADLAIGGWEFHGVARVQSGSPNNLGNLKLVGMSVKELQDSIKIRRVEGSKLVYWLPQDIIDNTLRAYGNFKDNPGESTNNNPTGKYLAPANFREPLGTPVSPTGFSNLIVYGPRFARYDLTAMKRFKITETKNFEFRAEFLNAFNHTNFLLGGSGNDVNILGVGGASFGQTTNAYQDLSTTNDPGGRLIQFVLRLNF